jgi:hypothetical protein
VKPSAVRNCTIRSYTSSSSSSSSSAASAAYNSSSVNSFDSLPYFPNNDIQSFGKESNYLNAQHLKAKRKVTKDEKVSPTSMKFNQNKRDLINTKNNNNINRNVDNVKSVGTGVGNNEYKVKILKRRKRNKSNLLNDISRATTATATTQPTFRPYAGQTSHGFHRDIFILNGTYHDSKIRNESAAVAATASLAATTAEIVETLNDSNDEDRPQFSYLKSNLQKSSDTVNSHKHTSSNAATNSGGHNINNNNNHVQYQELYDTASIIELECIAGYDGGLPQHFQLEGYDVKSQKIRLNLTSIYHDLPLFRVDLTGNWKMKRYTCT